MAVACGSLNRREPGSKAVEAVHRSETRPTSRLRIATYNVHMESASAIASAMAADPEFSSADVLLLQEIEHGEEDAPANLAAHLGWNYVYAPGYGLADAGSHGLAILSRFPLQDVRAIELPRRHVVVNSARRVALRASLQSERGELRIYNVHLDNRLNPEDRTQQLEPVLVDATKSTSPVLIAGDFNTSPFCWIAHLVPVPCGIQDNRLEDHVRRSGFSTPTRRSGSTHKRLGMRLDAIYTRDLEVDRMGVARRALVSDHLPLWIDVLTEL